MTDGFQPPEADPQEPAASPESRSRRPPGLRALLIATAVIVVIAAFWVSAYMGSQGGGLSAIAPLAVLLAALFVFPWVLANLALLRLGYCFVTGQSPDLRITKGFSLSGSLAILAPAGLWAALFVAREYGQFDADVYQQSSNYSWSTYQAKRDDPDTYEVTFDDDLPREALVEDTKLSLVSPNRSDFVRGFRSGFRANASGLHQAYADITLDANSPLCFTPLVKIATGRAKGQAVLRFVPIESAEEVRYEVTIEFETTIRRYGISSGRAVREELGAAMGRAYAKAMKDILQEERSEAQAEQG